MVKFQDILKVVAGVFVGFVLFLITVETEIEKLQIELSSIRRLTLELEEGLTELRELQNSNKIFENESYRNFRLWLARNSSRFRFTKEKMAGLVQEIM